MESSKADARNAPGIPAPEEGRWRGVGFRALLALVCFVLGLGVFVWLRPLTVVFSVVQGVLRLDGVRREYLWGGGFRIYFSAGGAGQPIVLVHGLGGRSE